MRFTAEMIRVAIPDDFISDGCSDAPDVLWGVNVADLCVDHDALYCQRIWKAGALDQVWRTDADWYLGRGIMARLPWWQRWAGWVYHWFVHRFGGDNAFASCGPLEGERCRHNVATPEWMR